MLNVKDDGNFADALGRPSDILAFFEQPSSILQVEHVAFRNVLCPWREDMVSSSCVA